jgi:hypothetical protein
MDEPFPTDLVLLSSDQVYFFVHSARLLKHSGNGFAGLLGDDKVYLPENSEVLNLILHAFYNLDSSKFRPTVEMVAAALRSLQNYDVSLDELLTPSHTYVDNHLASRDPVAPRDVCNGCRLQVGTPGDRSLEEAGLCTSPQPYGRSGGKDGAVVPTTTCLPPPRKDRPPQTALNATSFIAPGDEGLLRK